MDGFNIQVDDRIMRQGLKGLAGKQLPYAASRAINDTLNDIKRETVRALPTVLDRPTPFTLNGMYISPARKTRLIGVIGWKKKQAEYLAFHEDGGTRRPKRKAIAVGQSMRRNKYGNLPRGAVARSIRGKKAFVGKVKGTAGVWQRTGRKGRGGLKLLVSWEDKATYRKKPLRFKSRALKVASKTFNANLKKRLSEALRGG